jgi:twitching motility protein PilT
MSESTKLTVGSKEYVIDPLFNIFNKTKPVDVEKLLTDMLTKRASDSHLKSPTGPVYRIDGELNKDDSYVVTPQDVEDVFCKIATDAQKSTFYAHNEVDFAYSIPGVARFRVNVHRQRGTLSIAFRVIPFKIPTFEDLGLPKICRDLVMKPRDRKSVV